MFTAVGLWVQTKAFVWSLLEKMTKLQKLHFYTFSEAPVDRTDLIQLKRRKASRELLKPFPFFKTTRTWQICSIPTQVMVVPGA